MKKYLFLALGVAALTSCSSDEVTELNQGNEIKFSVVADNDSRAHTVYCNNNLMESFNLYACYEDSKTFIDGDVYTVANDGSATGNHSRYWPETGNLDFYATVNGTATLGTWPAAPTIADFEILTDVTAQKDLLYAVAPDKGKTADAITLNFRHALSQIEFRAKNTNADLHVEVTAVRVGRVNSIDTYNLPTGATDTDKYDIHQTPSATDRNVANEGKWTTPWANNLGTLKDYEVSFDAIVADADGADLTITANTEHAATETNSLLLLPTIWDGNDAGTTAWQVPTSGGFTSYDGTYLAVKCTIWNVMGATVNKTDDAVLHDDAWAIIPVEFNWAEGKKYIYTFVFGKGNAGYEEDSTDPVLWPIKLDVDVDDFVDGETYDPTDMVTNGTSNN